MEHLLFSKLCILLGSTLESISVRRGLRKKLENLLLMMIGLCLGIMLWRFCGKGNFVAEYFIKGERIC